jgi:hypothetical protein
MLALSTLMFAQDLLTRATRKTATVSDKRAALAFSAGVILATTKSQETASFARTIVTAPSAIAPRMLDDNIQTALVKLRIVRDESAVAA